MTTKATDARTLGFRIRPLGFAKTDVLVFIANLQTECARAREAADSLLRQINEAKVRDMVRLMEKPVRLDDPAHLIEHVLSSVHRVAEDVRKAAEQDAQRVVEDAKAGAARMLEEAAANVAEQQNAALVQLRDMQREIDCMQVRRRELTVTLESIVAALGEALADVREHSTLDDSELTESVQ